MKNLVAKWIGKSVHVTLRTSMPTPIQGILIDADEFGIMLELPKGDTFIPVTSILHMSLLAQSFPLLEVFAASMAQATAMGAALAIHQHWNSHPIPGDIITLKMYTVPKEG